MSEFTRKAVAGNTAGILIRIQERIWKATLAKYKFEKTILKETIKIESGSSALIVHEYRFVLKEKGGKFIKPTLTFSWAKDQKYFSIDAIDPFTNVDLVVHSTRNNVKRIVKVALSKDYLGDEVKIELRVKETDSKIIENYVSREIENLSVDIWNYHVEINIKNNTDSFIENYLVKFALNIRKLPDMLQIQFGKEKQMAKRAKREVIEKRIRGIWKKILLELHTDRVTSQTMEMLFGGKKSITLFELRKSPDSPEPIEPFESMDEKGKMFYSFKLNLNPNQSGNYLVHGEKLKEMYDIMKTIEEKSKKKHVERKRYA